jgi:hypothetical protein
MAVRTAALVSSLVLGSTMVLTGCAGAPSGSESITDDQSQTRLGDNESVDFDAGDGTTGGGNWDPSCGCSTGGTSGGTSGGATSGGTTGDNDGPLPSVCELIEVDLDLGHNGTCIVHSLTDALLDPNVKSIHLLSGTHILDGDLNVKAGVKIWGDDVLKVHVDVNGHVDIGAHVVLQGIHVHANVDGIIVNGEGCSLIDVKVSVKAGVGVKVHFPLVTDLLCIDDADIGIWADAWVTLDHAKITAKVKALSITAKVDLDLCKISHSVITAPTVLECLSLDGVIDVVDSVLCLPDGTLLRDLKLPVLGKLNFLGL